MKEKENYISPKSEVFGIRLEGVIAASEPDRNPKYNEWENQDWES